MQKVSVDLPQDQAEALAGQLVERLAPAARLRLAQKLEAEARRARWEPLVKKMRRRFARHPFSWRELRRVCEEVRQEQQASPPRFLLSVPPP